MNGAHIHLIVNHLPVVGALFCLLALGWALWWRDLDSQRFSMVCLVLLGISSGLAYVSGEPAEEVVESIATVSNDFLEDHEDAAWIALLGGLACGLIGLIGLTVPIVQKRNEITFCGLAAVIVTFGLLAWTASLGGAVRHTEIRPAEKTAGILPSPYRDED